MNRALFFTCCAALAGCGEPRTASDAEGGTAALDDGVGEGTAGEGGSGSASGGQEAESSAGSGGVPRLDVGDGASGGGADSGGCGGYDVCERVEFSYVWVANTNDATVSKIDTRTMAEVGRYFTSPDLEAHPSRTAVSFDGRAVAVANRWTGGVTKIWADDIDCVDRNGNGVIDTSTGAADVRPWMEDECIAWFAPKDFSTQRPVAWAAGAFNEATCAWEEQTVWTAGCEGPAYSVGGGGPSHAIKLDGRDGSEIIDVAIEDFPCTATGPYGGALDHNGDFWISARTPSVVARVRADGSATDVWDAPQDVMPYGITVDRDGRVWVSNAGSSSSTGGGVARFDPDTETWARSPAGFQSLGGVVQGPDGRMFAAQFSRYENGQPFGRQRGIAVIDPESLARVETFDFDGFGATVKGLSFDVDGYLWATTTRIAYRFDISDWSEQTYEGLTVPYTYSDMTGSALFNVHCPPAG